MPPLHLWFSKDKLRCYDQNKENKRQLRTHMYIATGIFVPKLKHHGRILPWPQEEGHRL